MISNTHSTTGGKKHYKAKSFFKVLDIYAKPINLTYDGSEKFRTFCGGLISFFVIMFLMSLFLFNIRDLALRNQTQIKKNTLVS